MKESFFKIISLIALIIPTKVLIRLSGKKIIYPFYHIVSDNPPPHIKHLYPVRNIKQFEKDLDFLEKHFSASGFPPKDKNNLFVLSFDDGLSEIYNTVAPILKKRKIPAIFFLNSAFVDNKNIFNNYVSSLKKENPDTDINEYLIKQKPYLTSRQISKLKTEGFTLGAHGVTHPLFSGIPEDEQIRQTEESIKFVTENFGETQKLFAFPFTDNGIKNSFFNNIFENKIADYTFGTAGIKDDVFERNIQRIPVEKYGLSAKRHIKTEYLLYIIKKISGKNFVNR
ncbi:MAG: polysaccharide deacetylase family protein [Chlorobi bacterium]|nr:polysaccharide deacetylase family protein [Chlorobiota bacterium]